MSYVKATCKSEASSIATMKVQRPDPRTFGAWRGEQSQDIDGHLTNDSELEILLGNDNKKMMV